MPTVWAIAPSPGGSACRRDSVAWDDLFLGRVADRPVADLGGDFIVARHGVGHSYQLAVVADDAAMGVNQVIRGADLVPSTPRRSCSTAGLGWPEPGFGHVPLAIAPDGRRLAKRDGSLKLATLREPASIRAGWSAP